MKTPELIRRLQYAGINQNESRVLLAAMSLPNSPASTIAKKAQMGRITTYSILGKLIEKGFVQETISQGTKRFSAIDPKTLIAEVSANAKSLKAALPVLQTLSKTDADEPESQMFVGIDAVKKAYAYSLEATTEILNYANSQNIRDHWEDYDTTYVQARIERQIYLRGLAPNDIQGIAVQKNDPRSYREIRLLEKDLFAVENEINIWNDSVLITSFAPRTFAILIKSRSVAQTQRQIFEMMWRIATA